MRRRLPFLLCFVAAIGLGLASRKFKFVLPEAVAPYVGDTVWGAMIYFLVRVTHPAARPMYAMLLAVAVCFGVEISQLYHAPWIDSVRATRLGGLVLGFGFLWSDLICYTVGVVGATALEVATGLGCACSRPLPPKAAERE